MGLENVECTNSRKKFAQNTKHGFKKRKHIKKIDYQPIYMDIKEVRKTTQNPPGSLRTHLNRDRLFKPSSKMYNILFWGTSRLCPFKVNHLPGCIHSKLIPFQVVYLLGRLCLFGLFTLRVVLFQSLSYQRTLKKEG